MLSKVASSACSAEIMNDGARGFYCREFSSCWVLPICCTNIFHCFSRFPKEMWVVTIYKNGEWGRLSLLVEIIHTPSSPV